MVETVERERPVWRATCARLVTPSSWSAWITRKRLDARRDGAEPGSSSIRAILPDLKWVCQGLGRSFDEFDVNLFELGVFGCVWAIRWYWVVMATATSQGPAPADAIAALADR